tara:strand:- start:161295 stop:161567 length:273 start_codon:yes stop_codon:yes gene_type:complete
MSSGLLARLTNTAQLQQYIAPLSYIQHGKGGHSFLDTLQLPGIILPTKVKRSNTRPGPGILQRAAKLCKLFLAQSVTFSEACSIANIVFS